MRFCYSLRKRLFIFFQLVFLAVFTTSLPADETSDAVTWSWKADENFFIVTMRIKKGFHSYEDKTFLLTSPKVSFSEMPSSSTIKEEGIGTVKVYDGGLVHTWKIKLSDLDYPLTIGAEYQVCGDAVCHLPQAVVLARFKNSDALKKNVFTVPDEDADEVFLKDDDDEKTSDATNSDGVVFMPDFQIVRSADGYMPPVKFIKFLKGEDDEEFFSFEDKGFIISVLLAILGGILLNFTPCILPLIPVNLAIIGAVDGSKMSRIVRGLFYGLGMMISYGAIGVAAAVTGGMFGMLDASWIFNAGVSIVFVFLGLAMFDVVQIDFSRFRTSSANRTFRLGGVFLLGALSAVLAGACVAPVVIAVIIRSAALYADGNALGLLLPLVLGFGMALPWPIASAGLSVLPKPGKWMMHVKHVLGIFIFCLAVWYFVTALGLFTSERSYRQEQETDAKNVLDAVASALKQGEKEGKCVLLDFGASWCKSCGAMEVRTLNDADVKKELENFVLVKVGADDPSEEATKQILAMFDVQGLPKFVIVSPAKGK